jgi:Spy/CpxP family protein refolding chaperone
MHPGLFYWWKTHRGGGSCHAYADCGPSAGEAYGWRPRPDRWTEALAASHRESELGAGAFGVRRPLRFLAYKLDLDEQQVAELARILSDLKTERAQAEVDGRRAVAGFADAISGEQFDTARATGAGAIRVATAEHLRDAVVKALTRLHALLEPEQRERLAYLIRTGTLQI